MRKSHNLVVQRDNGKLFKRRNFNPFAVVDQNFVTDFVQRDYIVTRIEFFKINAVVRKIKRVEIGVVKHTVKAFDIFGKFAVVVDFHKRHFVRRHKEVAVFC